MSLKWEDVDDKTQRARIFGGWLVKHNEDVMTNMHDKCVPSNGYEWRVAMCFVPDPASSWRR